jgi:hypothetical protein
MGRRDDAGEKETPDFALTKYGHLSLAHIT